LHTRVVKIALTFLIKKIYFIMFDPRDGITKFLTIFLEIWTESRMGDLKGGPNKLD
jgi:hypothetical protein